MEYTYFISLITYNKYISIKEIIIMTVTYTKNTGLTETDDLGDIHTRKT